MRKGSSAPRTVFVHAGTHKTGSTALQYFLARNERALAAAGVFVPRTGRLAEHPEGCGHHNIATELFDPGRYDPRLGSLDDLSAEIAACGQPRACISSEQFEPVNDPRAGLLRLRDAFAEIGYATTIIVYLRPQADYLEALYAEIAKGGHFHEFGRCLDEIVASGVLMGGVLMSYERLIGILVAVFSRDNVIVRPYRRNASLDRIVREFGTIIGLTRQQISTCDLVAAAPINARASYAGTIAALYAAGTGKAYFPGALLLPEDLADAVARIDGPFDPLRLPDIMRIVRRFGLENFRLSRRYRATFGCVSAVRLLRAVSAALRGDRANEERRQLLDRMIARIRLNVEQA